MLASSLLLDLKRKQWLSRKEISWLYLIKPVLMPYSPRYSTVQKKTEKNLCLNGCNYREIMTRLILENANVDYIHESKL